INRTRGGFAEAGLELGEHLLDRVEVGAVGREVSEFRARGLDGLANALDLVRAEIVHHDDVAGPKGRREELLGPGAEDLPVDRAVDDARGVDAVEPERGDKGAGLPMAVRHAGYEPLAPGRTAV